jgi:hypothetical protein
MNEIYRLWMEEDFEDRKCGCGETFLKCGFWQAVRSYLPPDEQFARRLLFLQQKVDHTRFFWTIYSGLCSEKFEERLAEYKRKLSALYGAISKASEERIIVDSSKVPSRALILSEMDDVDIAVVHLIRDARAVTHAWAKRAKVDPSLENKTLDRHPFWWMAAKWGLVNLCAELLNRRSRYIRLRYEDFVGDPSNAISSLLSEVGWIDESAVALTDERIVELGEIHSMSGNPQRFETGPVKIRRGSNWREKIGPMNYAYSTAVSWPLLIRYGYEL